MKMSSGKAHLSLWPLCLCLLLVLAGCSPKQKAVHRVSDLPGSTIGVQLGTTADTKVSAMEHDHAGTQIERFTKTADAVQALLQGKLSCVVEDEQPARAFVSENDGLAILPQAYSREDYAFCVAKGRRDLVERINHALTLLRNDGTLEAIARRHIKEKIGVAYQPKAIGNELITLLKETSISGYIGLVDLTKGSDIIRSITYDAILPLGVVALIYLAIVLSLSSAVSAIEKKLRKNER